MKISPFKIIVPVLIIMGIILPFQIMGAFTSAPAISDLAIADVTYSSVSISWKTDRPSSGAVDYGPGSSYGSTAQENSQTNTAHTLTISGLQPDTIYHYRVHSSAQGKIAEIADRTFTTGHISRIAYVSDKSGHPEIYVMNADGSSPRQLTSGNSSNAMYERLAWSPDGKWLTFVSKTRDVSDYYRVAHGINVIAADGSSMLHLTDDTRYPSWRDSDKVGILNKYWILNGSTWRAAAASDPELAFDPGISPNRQKYASIAWDSDFIPNVRGKIYTIEFSTGTKVAITSTYYFDEKSNLAWSPDGSKIIFVSREGELYSTTNERCTICITNSEGSNLQRLTDGLHKDVQPCWSADGKKICFVSNIDGNNQLYTMNVDGSGRTRLTVDTSNNTSPAWSQ